jgi:hypothetical protein
MLPIFNTAATLTLTVPLTAVAVRAESALFHWFEGHSPWIGFE